MTVDKGDAQFIEQKSASVQYMAAAACSLNIITSGMHYGWPSPSLPKLQSNESTIHITSDEGSLMAIMVLIGSILGSLIVATIVDILGRKWTIILSSFPYFASWMMIAYANSAMMISIARFIAGVIDGWIFTAGPMYMAEIAHPKIRGMLGSGIVFLWIFGMLLINIIGSYLDIKTAALVSSAVPVACLVLFLPMPESPYYYILRKNMDKAKQSLQKFRGTKDVDQELNRITLAVKQQTENSGKFLDLFTVKSNRKAAYIVMILRGAGQMAGQTAITFYFQQIFIDAGESAISPQVASILYFTIQSIVCAFSSSIVDKAGRRPLLMISIIGSALALSVEGTYFLLKDFFAIDMSNYSLVPIISLIAFVIIFSLGVQGIPMLMLSELFPANVKAFALCFADIYVCSVAAIVSKVFQVLNDNYGLTVPFYGFASSCVIAMFLIYFFVPETKGKTLEEIQEILKAEKSDPDKTSNLK